MIHPTRRDAPNHRKTASRAIALAGSLWLAHSAAAQVELRGGAWVDDAVVEVGPAGVRVAAADSSTRLLGWHEVKRVSGENEAQAAAFRSLSDDVWRAWMRLQRGDYDLAEPIFERLWRDALAAPSGQDAPPTIAMEGPTGMVIAEGVARIRLWRGALPSAVEPWATSVALRRDIAGDAAGSISVLDPQLPPVFVHSLAVERLATSEPNAVVRDDAVAAALFDLYRWLAQRTYSPDAPFPEIDSAAASHPDVSFVLSIARAQRAESQQRQRAADALQAVARADAGSWREAWARFGIGVAALRADDERARLLGVVQILHVPSRFSVTQRHLAGHALALAAIEFRRRGEETRAATLRAELEKSSPSHPAIPWMDRASAERAP